jgi:N-acetylmuramoyl-L-alanine amidase
MTALIADHDGAVVHPSPNCNERRDGKRPDMILLHYTGMESGAAAEAWLANPIAEVSAHYVVRENGLIVQMVPEAARAWHAGKSFWQGETDINSRSIGIEIINPGHDNGYPAFPDAQIVAVIGLCQGIIARHAVVAERVLAHSDVAPGRKVDPGEKFPWRRLFEAGVGHWIEPVAVSGGMFLAPGDSGQPVEALQSMLSIYGYNVEINGIFDDKTRICVAAFQRHFRPARVDGVADRSTIETLHRLLKALPQLVA